MRRGSVTLSFLAFAGLLAVSAIGCSRQLEGERCSLLNGNNDCDGTLLCTDYSKLRNGSDMVDRCCPDPEDDYSDSRCAPKTGGTTDDDRDVDAGGGAGGGSSDDGNSSEGEACDYNSDCTAPFICGPSGVCQPECKTDRDCTDGKVCSSEQVCVAE